MEMFVAKLSDSWDIMMTIKDNYQNMMDNTIAEYLNLTHEEYKSILHKHYGKDINPIRITFKTESQAKKALKELESYYILAKLVE